MQKYRSERPAAPTAPGLRTNYRPAIDAHAQELIARIQADNQDVEAVLALEAHYEVHRDYPSLANLLEGWAPTLHDDERAAHAYAKAADAALRGLDDRARGQRLLQRALERHPEYEVAFMRLTRMLIDDGDDTALERCLAQRVADLARRDADPALRARMHLRLGELYEERLLLRGRAIAEYRSAVELDATLVPAIARARGIYLNSGKIDAAADMFELQIAATPDATGRHALLIGLAKHRRHVMGDLDGAILVLRRAIKALPAEPPTFEMLAEMLAARARRKDNENAQLDRERAAELYYQVARSLPRATAAPRLEACLLLQPEHARARRLLEEIAEDAGEEPSVPGESIGARATRDRRTTGRHPTAQMLRGGDTLPGLGLELSDADLPFAEDLELEEIEEDVAAWLDDAAVTPIEEAVSTQRMIPISDRPPPPAAPAPAKKRRAKSSWPN
jgi:tetratricopeptide (TPR) repeat protein